MALRRFLPLVLLAATSVALWCMFTGRGSAAAWQTPLQLSGDPLEVYARIQAASEDLTQPLRGYANISRLGAPFSADWSRYPVSDRVVFTGLGALARWVGVFAALNLAIIVVHALNALSFFLCARHLRWRTEWCFALALLFSFSSYNFRWGVTVSLSLTFFLPPLLLFCAWLARSGSRLHVRRWTLLGGVLGVWLGGGNPYLAFFAAQLVALALGLRLLRRRLASRTLAALVFFAALGVSFLLHHVAYFLADAPNASAATLDRNYAGSEIYALKLTDLLVPPAEHPLPAFAALGQRYQRESALPTEFFVNYLGVAGTLGLVILLWAGLRGAVRQRASSTPDAFLGVAWFTLFAAVGGFNSLLALAGFDLFRASSRASIFVLAWSLLFLGAWCHRQRWLRHPALRFTVPALIAILGLLDSVPQLNASTHLRQHAATLQATREVTSALEQNLGRDARIFQLPAPTFPEAGPVGRMADYEHFLPYLCSDTLRFSYGALRGTTLAHAATALAQLPPSALMEKLTAHGFAALWIDHRAYADNATSMVAALRAQGLGEFSQNALPHISILLLPPTPNAQPVLFDPDLFPPWESARSFPLRLAVFEGWYPLERDGARAWRWAVTDASMGFVAPKTGTVSLGFRAYSRGAGELTLEVDGREIWREPVTRATREPRSLTVPVTAGRHHLVWRYTGGTRRGSRADPRQLGFALENLEFTFLPQP